MKDKAVAIVSGGMDSVTMAYLMKNKYDLHLVTFDYGQRHKKEIGFAKLCAEKLGAEHTIIDLSGIGKSLKSALTTPGIDVPHGYYTDEVMKITVVPNRNAIMIAIACGIALSEDTHIVAFGAHTGDHFIYPDCRPEFLLAIELATRLGNDDHGFSILTPFVNITKSDIVIIGTKLGISYQDTWSCYEGNHYHCGKCGTCIERIEAFNKAGVEDPTIYVENIDDSEQYKNPPLQL